MDGMRGPLAISPGIFVPPSGVRITASRASGPGGQNVNKVSSKVDVRVDVTAIVGIDDAARARLRALAGRRIDADGWLQFVRQDTRDQIRNLELALEAVRGLVRQALVRPKRRRPTRPSKSATKRRLDTKRRRGEEKRRRAAPRDD